ncbi:MAG: patatin [Lysobacteraceae bacterium]|nr:MAG: patatin [Xanthomonadaceae bacterium]
MLTLRTSKKAHLQPASGKIGLAVAGGGPLGGIYELGALLALDEAMIDRKLVDLDVYVGVSAGAFVAAGMANAMSTSTMCRIFVEDETPEHPFRPELFLKPAFAEYWQRMRKVPGLVADSVWSLLTRPFDSTVSEQLGRFGKAIPTGFFDNDGLNQFLSRVFATPGRTNDFRQLSRALYIVAVDLDSGAAVRFGAPGFDHVPISKAVQASAALPGLYPPVEIDSRSYVDGVLRRTLHASVALDSGVDLVIGINPLVPYDASKNQQSHKRKLVDGGLPLVLSQTLRALIQSRMQIGLEKNQAVYDDSDLLLLEPNRDDGEMFFTNVFSYSSRKRLGEHAYQATRSELLAKFDELNKMLGRHGLQLDRATLEDPDRTMEQAIRQPPSRVAMTEELTRTLDRLRRVVAKQ